MPTHAVPGPGRRAAAAAALACFVAALGCGDESPFDAKSFDAGDPTDLGSDAGFDVPADRGADVPADRGVDVPADRGVDAGVDATADRPADVPLDRPVDAAMDVATDRPTDTPTDVPGDRAVADGGYAVAEITAAAPSIRGGASLTVDATLVSECAENEVAVGIAVGLEGRSYVAEGRLECAALDATGTAFAPPHWAGGDPPAGWSQGHCPTGQHVVGLLGVAGDILDRLGAQCAALGWTPTDARTALGPWGGTLTDRAEPCPPSSAVQRLSVSQVTYFGGTTALGAEVRCRRVAPR